MGGAAIAKRVIPHPPAATNTIFLIHGVYCLYSVANNVTYCENSLCPTHSIQPTPPNPLCLTNSTSLLSLHPSVHMPFTSRSRFTLLSVVAAMLFYVFRSFNLPLALDRKVDRKSKFTYPFFFCFSLALKLDRKVNPDFVQTCRCKDAVWGQVCCNAAPYTQDGDSTRNSKLEQTVFDDI